MRDSTTYRVAVGFFDGVHLGHQAILRRADAAFTFRNHPLTVLSSALAPKLIMCPERRIEAVAAAVSTGKVTAPEFTTELANLSAEDFVKNILLPMASPRPLMVVCGNNWRFGRGGVGDAALLKRMGLAVEVVPAVEFDGAAISSTRIREALAAGNLEAAKFMLGRDYEVYGSCFHGKGVGGELGFATVNLDIGDTPLRNGVYVVEVAGIRGIANLGVAPTFAERAWEKPMLEIHFPGRDKAPAMVDGVSAIKLVRFLRDERKFSSTDELRLQIAADCATIQV